MKPIQLSICLILIALLALPPSSHSGAWPTYRGDISRSGVVADEIPTPLEETWVFRSKYPPQPAWPGPARRDGWHKTENLKPRVVFDWAFHVISADGSVFFGSSVDDKVYCLDSNTGELRWTFFTDGPVRLAPTFADGNLYVGSDDGNVYCLDSKTGGLIWKYQAAPEDLVVPGNGRVVSIWPIRSGVLVDGGIAYFTAGLFSFEGAYVCALEAESGKEIWKRKIPNLTPQGYLLASKDRLYVPTGRGEPFVIDRATGDFLYSVEGAGGTFCLLSEDVLIYGPGKQGTFEAFKPGDKDEIATFQGNTMIVTPDRSFLHTDTELTAIDRKRYMEISEEKAMLLRKHRELRDELKKVTDKQSDEAVNLQKQIDEIESKAPEMDKRLSECLLWKKDCKYPYSLVEAGDGKLFAGGYKSVAAFEASTGELAWSAPVAGRALDLAVSDGKLYVSTDEGTIHCFAKP